MLTSEGGKLYALAMNAGVKEANPLSSTLYMIIPLTLALDRIHPMTSGQGNNSSLVETFVILDLNMLLNKFRSSKPAFGIVFS